MPERLSRLELAGLADCASWRDGMHTGWRVKTMPKLEAKGLVEKRPVKGIWNGVAWFVTDNGRRILQEKSDA